MVQFVDDAFSKPVSQTCQHNACLVDTAKRIGVIEAKHQFVHHIDRFPRVVDHGIRGLEIACRHILENVPSDACGSHVAVTSSILSLAQAVNAVAQTFQDGRIARCLVHHRHA